MGNDILSSINKNSKVMLYPSSCDYSGDFQNLPFDAVILNSRVFRKPRRKGKVYCLRYDNNELLGILAARGLRVSALVVIRDGCCEGGNYECVAREGFFGRLMPVAAEDLVCSFDHAVTDGLNVPAFCEHIVSPDYVGLLRDKSSPIGPMRTFRVTMKRAVGQELVIGKVRVKVVHDSIWRNVMNSELCVVRAVGSANEAITNYLKGLRSEATVNTRFEFVSEPRQPSIRRFLELAESEQYPRVSVMPIAKGAYGQIIDEIRNWEGTYPHAIAFFHLNSGDFGEFKRLAAEVS